MKKSISLLSKPWVVSLALIASLAGISSASAKDKTAFEQAKEGNRYIGEQSKDKIVQIRSEKSVGSTTPNIWTVVYYDPTATLKAVEVRFVGDKMASVKRPFRLLEPITNSQGPLESKYLKIDSDKAISLALKESVLEHLTITATQLKLDHGEGVPVWKVRLWAQKLKDTTKSADIGEIILTADEGKVEKLDVHPNRVE